MSDKGTFSPPQNLLQAGTSVAAGVIGGLGGSPSLLGLILLNMAFIVGASWFLLQQEQYRHDERMLLGELLRECIDKASRQGTDDDTDEQRSVHGLPTGD